MRGRTGSTVARAMLALGVCCGVLLEPLPANPQTGRIVRVGVLARPTSPNAEAFRQGMRALGYAEGQNVAFEYRSRSMSSAYATIATSTPPSRRCARHASRR